MLNGQFLSRNKTASAGELPEALKDELRALKELIAEDEGLV